MEMNDLRVYVQELERTAPTDAVKEAARKGLEIVEGIHSYVKGKEEGPTTLAVVVFEGLSAALGISTLEFLESLCAAGSFEVPIEELLQSLAESEGLYDPTSSN